MEREACGCTRCLVGVALNSRFEELLREANKAYESMSPQEKARLRREQAISWVMGEQSLAGRPVSRELAEEIYDEMHPDAVPHSGL